MDVLEWLFDGLGTMLLGVLFGSAGTLGIQLVITKRRHTQRLRNRDGVAVQAGHDVIGAGIQARDQDGR